ncbi:hypothetical protein F4859DRAFT_516275 [Xylaria cf. heliscus]|nr:hypothetical protein F4859DRAFT_516275 [Xylaria cf. heliscus]
MRGLWQCSGCVGLLVLGMLTQPGSADREENSEYQNELHWIEKSQNIFQHVKRKDVCRQDGWSLCPSSVGGGCCPNYYECDTASCYATTAGPTSCGGKTGYFACALTLGAGSCCPVGLRCDDTGNCIPPVDVTTSQSCQPNWFGCPVSLGGGCCRNGWVCGDGLCYNPTPQTLPVSETLTTTDSRGHTTITVVTSLTVITDIPTASSGSPTVAGVPQVIPSTVAKVDAIQTSNSSGGGGGLSSGALGGIVTAVVVILIAIVVAATFIVLRLKKAERAAKEATESKRESGSQPRSQKSGFGQPTISEIGSTTDVDPMRKLPIMRPPSVMSEMANRSPSHTPNFTNSASSSPPPVWGTTYNYAPSVASDGRQTSLDYPRHDNAAARMSQTISVDSRRPYGHGRQPSDTSELEGTHGVSEIYTTVDNEAESQRRSNSITRHAKAYTRKNSDVSGQNRARGDSSAGAGALDTVNENIDLHGYYGSSNMAVGQTGASLDRSPSPAPSHKDT